MVYANAVAQIVAAVSQRDRRPSVIGVDGQSGAGKSTLSRELMDSFAGQAALIRGDDFYRVMPASERMALEPEQGYHRYFDWERLRAQVLMPVHNGAPRIRYQQYDWEQDRLAGWVDITAPPVVIVEGVYTLRRELRTLIDVAVYVDSDPLTRRARTRARGENPAEWIRRWVAAENFYVARDAPARHADLIVGGC